MFRSHKLFDIYGIPIKLHGTLILFLIFGGFLFSMGTGATGFLLTIAVLACAFGLVLLHELGHSAAALHFGIPVREITLYPIGGIAAIAHMPKSWFKEFVIALAGPAVNFVLAGAFALLYILFPIKFLSFLIGINLFLGLFNLLPGFPMDGGRVLRALLARTRPYLRATQIAAQVGQYVAIGLGVLGFLSLFMPLFSPMLIFIGIFVYFAAKTELARVALEDAAERGRIAMDPLTALLFPESRQGCGGFAGDASPHVHTWTFRVPRNTPPPRRESGHGRIIDIRPDES